MSYDTPEEKTEIMERFGALSRPERRRIERLITKGMTMEMAIEIEIDNPKLTERIVPPHNRVSKKVEPEDMERVLKDSVILWKLCFQPLGMYKSAYAMAHPQIDSEKPLRMFVTADRDIVINPVIIKGDKPEVNSHEGCMTYTDEPMVMIKRSPEISVEYVTVMVDPEDETKFKLSSVQKKELVGHEAFCFQHEVDHLNGIYVYDYQNNNE